MWLQSHYNPISTRKRNDLVFVFWVSTVSLLKTEDYLRSFSELHDEMRWPLQVGVPTSETHYSNPFLHSKHQEALQSFHLIHFSAVVDMINHISQNTLSSFLIKYQLFMWHFIFTFTVYFLQFYFSPQKVRFLGNIILSRNLIGCSLCGLPHFPKPQYISPQFWFFSG